MTARTLDRLLPPILGFGTLILCVLIIELLIRTFTVPEDEALLCKGSFLMYKVALQSHGRPFVEVPMRSGYRWKGQVLRPAMVRVRG